jgi:tRNA(Ile)-lysidine synthase
MPVDFFDYAPPPAGKPAELFWSFMDFVRTRALLRPGERVLIGISGGADSTALALLLSPLRLPEGFLGLGLHLAHFNHQLRTESEAEADIRFVRTLAERLNVPISHGKGDVRSFARRRHLSIEDAARRLRYRFLAEEADAAGATAVAVGHTANDQAETVLMHIIRGAGLRGLRGMLPRSPWPFGKGPDLVRPLLNIRRTDTEFYCREMGVEPRDDPTNQSVARTRNRIRHVILPAMREINPLIDEALVRLSRSVESDVDYLEREAEGVWNSLAVEKDDAIQFGLAPFRDLDPALTSRLLARAATAAGGDAATPSLEQLNRVFGLLHSPRERWSLSFPGGVVVSARAPVLRVARRGKAAEQITSALASAVLEVPGNIEWDGWMITARRERRGGSQDRPYELSLSTRAIEGMLVVRSRTKGDRMRPMGLGGTKKVQDILVDRKVPADERDHVPLVCDDAGILWIPGHCVDERTAAQPRGERNIIVVVEPLKGVAGRAKMSSRARGSKAPRGTRRRAL